jgi:hypothetical protein
MEQIALAFEPVTQADRPKCRMCLRPAHWSPKKSGWGAYCAANACTNSDRICRGCGASFRMNTDGGGTKYCSLDCKLEGYHPRGQRSQPGCAWCGARCPDSPRSRGLWPYICSTCLYPIRHVVARLKDHRVSHERARRLRDDPSCEICGTDMLAEIRVSSRQIMSPLVVDHDHACCAAGKRSCGSCVRGLICRGCNSAAGHVYDSPRVARALADYLERVRKEVPATGP